MTTFDPTSLPLPPSPTTRGDVEYSVDDVARMQALSAGAAGTGVGIMAGADAEDETIAVDGTGGMSGAGTHTGGALTEAGAASNGRSERSGLAGVDMQGLRQRQVSGRYRGRSAAGELELELRVDVDGRRPLRRVSGDFYRRTGGTVTYVGSFIVTTPTLNVTPTRVVIDGRGIFTFQSGNPRLRVTISRVGEFMSPAAAIAQFLTPSGIPGARYTCAFESQFFRRVEFESDFVSGVQPFDAYDTGLLPSGGPARVLNVTAAYAEAGIEMVDTGGTDEVQIDWAGTDRIWTNRELHASMQNHFRLWRNEPGWRVWLLSATIHERGPGLRGIMFDEEGSQRQGCAVFHDVIDGTTNQVKRAQLRTYIHELGHCFNLYHSHHKEFMQPPQPNRLDALSWMHYPDSYQSSNGTGAGAYWAAFPFQFDDLELVHLRHAFRNDIIMGGVPFGIGAAEIDPLLFADAIEDNSGLRLKIRSARSYYFGEPVVVEFKLEATDTRGKRVNACVHPNEGYVQVGISKPGGRTVAYRPFLIQCAEPEMVMLDASRPAVYDSAYIGYGKDGLYFDEPGVYELRAMYHAPDGSKVLSNVLRLRVEAPIDKKEREIADQFLGDEQGKILYLLGSDAPDLKHGNEAFDCMLEQYPAHPMAVYARLVKGMNSSRPFKTIDTVEHTISVRPADLESCTAWLADVVRTTIEGNPTADPTADIGVDNITLNMAMQRLVEVRHDAGDVERAQATARLMIEHFNKDSIPEFVRQGIAKQMASFLQDEEGNAVGQEEKTLSVGTGLEVEASEPDPKEEKALSVGGAPRKKRGTH